MYPMVALAAYCVLGARNWVMRSCCPHGAYTLVESLRITPAITNTNRCCITAGVGAGVGKCHAAMMRPNLT